MKFHPEGKASIFLSFFTALLLIVLTFSFLPPFMWWGNLLWFGAFLFILNFFRNPDRTIQQPDEHQFYSPADGKVVVIEETFEEEVLKEKRLLVSIFMSPLDVHANRIPISGKITYSKHQPGKYLPAFNPKSSALNERHTIVIENKDGKFLIRQIAGAMARRICNYCQVGQTVQQGDELGFIKFGSRVDIFLPLETAINVELGQQVKGNMDVLAEF